MFGYPVAQSNPHQPPKKVCTSVVGEFTPPGESTLAIDASRSLSGGAVEYVRRIISFYPAFQNKFPSVHLWVHRSVVDDLPREAGVVLHVGKDFFLGKFGELLWQMFFLRFELALHKCDALIVLDSTYLGTVRPDLIVNQDLLAFEDFEIRKYPISLRRIRLEVIKFVQILAIRRSKVRVFLSDYSKSIIGEKLLLNELDAVIPHGYDADAGIVPTTPSLQSLASKRQRVYLSVSPVSRHKNYPQLLLGFEIHLRRFPNDRLVIVGGFTDKKLRVSIEEMLDSRPALAASVEFIGQVPHDEVSGWFSRADVFVFSSSCEACGVTLFEGLQSGLPMVVSDKSSIPEMVGDRGVYFDPYNPESLAQSLSNFGALIAASGVPAPEKAQAWEIRMNQFWCQVHVATHARERKKTPTAILRKVARYGR